MVFDAQSTIQYNNNATPTANLSLSWTHKVNGNCVVIPYVSETINVSTTPTGTVGGVSMTSLSHLQYYTLTFGSTYYIYVGVLGLIGAPAGSQTVTLTLPSGFSGWLVGGSLSYRNVKSFGTVSSRVSTGVPYVTASSVPTTNMVANIMGLWTAAPTNYSQISRLGGAFPSSAIRTGIIGDATGNGTDVVFSTTTSDTTAYGALAVPLKP